MPFILCNTSLPSLQYDRFSPGIVETRLESDSESRITVLTIYDPVDFLKSYQFSLFHKTRHKVGKLDAPLFGIERSR